MKYEYFQKVYFKINIETFPCIKYEDILYNFTNKYKNINQILFSKTKFFNLKNEMSKELINYNNNINLINHLDLYGEPLLKENIEFIKEDGTKVYIKIFATKLTLKLLSSKTISQYYQDGTYKIIPNLKEIKVLIVLIGKNISFIKFELILVATLVKNLQNAIKDFIIY